MLSPRWLVMPASGADPHRLPWALRQLVRTEVLAGRRGGGRGIPHFRERRFTMRRLIPIMALCVGALISVQAASGQVLPPSLQGEQFRGFNRDNFAMTGFGVITGTCNPDGVSTITYGGDGTATGPYPGTFTESGTYTIGPQVGGAAGPVLSFEASFTIDSPNGQVSGTKRLGSRPAVGRCSRREGEFSITVGGGQVITGQGVQTNVSLSAPAATYDALITTNAGEFRDSGETQVFGSSQSTRINNPCCVSQVSSGFFEFFTVSHGVIPVAPAAVVLTPPADVNPVSTSHTVTATVTTATGSPSQNFTVLFTVEGSVNVTGQCTTNAQGQCDFTYQGPDLPGADLIQGCADSNRDGDVDPGEPCGEASKIWILPATTPGQVTGGGWILVGGEQVSFGFNAQSKDVGDAAKGNCNVIDHGTTMHIKCATVDSLVVAGTHATFFGQATVAGVATNYRIDVDDLGEPGTGDTFTIQTDSGYVAAGVLQGGNIQIHK